ncbi:MAG: hypothetical protein GY913_32775 [Proteobacteria bacterium]|nr:hypothetical protein [Pseudomonadota bacterium]MCP4921698.1 hypothetical protein [Pseudomonadota bacterium]
MSWSLQVGAAPKSPGEAWAVEIQPRFQRVDLASRVRGHGTHDVGMRVSFQRYGPPVDHVQAVFERPEVQALCARISDGYSMSVLWSGDALGEWTEDAWDAAIALSELVTHAE